MKPNWTAVTIREVDIGHGVKAQHYYGSLLPPVRRMVLVQIDKSAHEAPCVAVGYMKLAAGEDDSPYFVVPGARPHFIVTHWADRLGDDFEAPLWGLKNEPSAVISSNHDPVDHGETCKTLNWCGNHLTQVEWARFERMYTAARRLWKLHNDPDPGKRALWKGDRWRAFGDALSALGKTRESK